MCQFALMTKVEEGSGKDDEKFSFLKEKLQ
jgi:hypothetical protein